MAQSDPSQPRRVKIRQVTQYQASFVAGQPNEDGTFTLQLVLDGGAEEAFLEPTARDVDVVLRLLERSPHTVFDVERGVLIFANLKA